MAGIFNDLVKSYRPSTLVGLYITDDSAQLLATPSSGAPWAKQPTEFWNGMTFWTYPLTDFRFRDVLRQGVDGFAYVSGDNTFARERFVVSKLDPVTGARKGTFINRGECFPALTLGDQSLVIGGTNKDLNLPVLFRWDGENDAKSRVTLGETDDPKLKWARYFTDLPGGETVQYHGVLNVAFDDAKTLVCSIFDAGSSQRKYFKVDVDTGAITGQPMTISSNQPPTVTITSPANNATFDQGQTIPITVDARDADGPIQRVSYYANNEFLGSANSGPWAYNWSTAYPGTYTITAKVIDNGGAAVRSLGVAVTVKAAVVQSVRIKKLTVFRSGAGMNTGMPVLGTGEDGSVWAWGAVGYKCGQARSEAIMTTPVKVPLSEAARDSMFQYTYPVVVGSSGAVYGWGATRPSEGLGMYPQTESPSPIQVTGSFGSSFGSVFETKNLVIGAGDKVFSWGGDLWIYSGGVWKIQTDYLWPQYAAPVQSGLGQIFNSGAGAGPLGLNSVLYAGGVVAFSEGTFATVPVAGLPSGWMGLDGLQGVIWCVDLGQSFVFRKSDGTTWVLGRNNSGQLGDSTTVDKTRYAVRNDVLNSFTSIEGAGQTAIGLKADGTVWGWGSGALLAGVVAETEKRPSPIQLPILSDIVAIAADGGGSDGRCYAVKRDGSVFAWGSNSDGILGVGSSDQRVVFSATRVPFP